MKDANQLAAEQERRERSWRDDLQPDRPTATRAPTIRGQLSIWKHVGDKVAGFDPTLQFENVAPPDLTKPGAIIVYDEDMDARIFFPAPNAYAEFCINREGE